MTDQVIALYASLFSTGTVGVLFALAMTAGFLVISYKIAVIAVKVTFVLLFPFVAIARWTMNR